MASPSTSGKVIILTGAGSGIGLALTHQLLSHPSISHVVAVDINTATALSPLLATHGGARLSVVQGSVAERATSRRAVDQAIARTGRLDCVVLNAGVLKPVGPAAETDVEMWKGLFDVNFFGLVHTIQLALPHLRATHGSILMTSSGVSLRPFGAWIPYACSKAAMNWLCACLAVEEEQVSMLCVTPGIVDTGQQAEVRDQHESAMPKKQYEWLSTAHARGEMLKPEQPASSFTRLVVNGIPPDLKGQVIAWDDTRIA